MSDDLNPDSITNALNQQTPSDFVVAESIGIIEITDNDDAKVDASGSDDAKVDASGNDDA